MATFFDEFLQDNFYEPVQTGDTEQRFGRLYTVPGYYPHQNLGFWRPSTTDNATGTSATNFKIVPANTCPDPFNHPTLATPPLASDEEFIVLRIKKRPVVMLIPELPIIEKRKHGGAPVTRKHCLVAQIYSTEKKGIPKFEEAFINNIRLLKYPQLMFIPQKAGAIQVDSLIRLDECQSVVTTNLATIPFQLTKEVSEELRSQFFYLFNNTDDGIFLTYRDILNLP